MSKDEELKATIHLPRTAFKMKANLPHREPEILDWWDRIDAYGRVAEARRGEGIGARLVGAVEECAREQGCTLLYLDTFTFQAPAFYAKLGFEVAAELPGFPGGVSKFLFKKALVR